MSGKKKETSRPPTRVPAELAAPSAPNPVMNTPSGIDWDQEAQAVAQGIGAGEEAQRRRRNLAGPSDSQLDWWRHNKPPVGNHHQAGDTERAAGEVLTWENDHCYWTTNGITTFGMAHTSRVCKDPPKPNTELFKDLRKKLDADEARSTP